MSNPPVLHCPPTLYIHNDSSPIDLAAVCLLVSLFHVLLVLVFDECITPRLAFEGNSTMRLTKIQGMHNIIYSQSKITFVIAF